MEINQYNFIRGSRNSGTTIFTRKLISNLKNQTIYYDLNIPSTVFVTKIGNQSSINTIRSPTLGKLISHINAINERSYDMINIVIDSITCLLQGDSDEFFVFVDSLPKNHRYFFITKPTVSFNSDKIDIESRNSTLMDYRNSFLVPENSISIFDVYKTDNEISAYNYNSNERVVLGDAAKIIRDIKINEILDMDKKNTIGEILPKKFDSK